MLWRRNSWRVWAAWVALVVGLIPAAADSLAEVLASGRFPEALRMADALLKTEPRDVRVWTVRGLALAGLGRDQEGLASFDRALQVEGSFLPALKGASETAYRSRDGRAAGHLKKLLSLEPGNETAHAMAAVLAFETRDCESAVSHFERSGGQVEKNELAASQFSDCLLRMGRPEQAAAVLERFLAAAPDSRTGRYNLAVAQLEARRPGAAIAALESLTSDAEALNLLAAAQAAEGKLEAAVQSLRTAAKLAPEDERNYLDLALLCQKHESVNLALEILDAGLRRLPGSARLHAMRGVLHAQLAELDQAAADFEQAGRLEPDQAYASVGLSVLLSQTGRLEGATRLLREKLAQSPQDATLNYLLADALLREGVAPQQAEFVEAREALQRSIRARPDFARARATLGKVYLLGGDAERAVQELRAALRHDPENRAALSQLMMALRKLGREQEAGQAAERLRGQYEKDLEGDAARRRVRISKPEEQEKRR